MNDFRLLTDVLVIGSGIAGATAALTLAESGVDVTLLTAGNEIFGGNTSLAQGGIVYTSDEDSPAKLTRDICTAGWNANYGKAVRHLAKHGPEVLRETLIEKYAVPFARRGDCDWALTREGGHGVPRILYCADHTGSTIMKGLAEAVARTPNIRVLPRRTAIDLLTTHHHADDLDYRYGLTNQCVGAYVFNDEARQVETILANFTVLATGGIGQIYLHTTNTAGSIGSGLAMAYRAGACVLNAEYVQFHPTTLFQSSRHKTERRFLISEAVRGEGAKLINSKGEPFMPRYDARADLAPRDIVTRAIMDEMLRLGDHCVYLDAAHHVQHDLRERFPTIYERCLEMGVDMLYDPIPVVPAAHYFCGGVLVDQNGRTTIERLYAAGETSCTGVHGANRLASTSLLEGVLWGHETGRDILRRLKRGTMLTRKLQAAIPDWRSPGNVENEDPALIAQDWATIRNTMWNYVGITRSTERLTRAYNDLRTLSKDLQDFYSKTPLSKPLIELFHGSQTAYIVTMAALRNTGSIGCHYRVR